MEAILTSVTTRDAEIRLAGSDDPQALRIVQSALRSLLRSDTEEAAVRLLVEAVHGLGGETVAASNAEQGDPAVLPVDLTFGLFEPQLPSAAPGSAARARLERHLPELVEDVRLVVERLRSEERLTEAATTDALTGLLNRRALGRVLGRLRPGSAVALIDIDHFKGLNDEHGHAVGDQALAAFGELLREGLRLTEHSARFGGEEFAVVFPDKTAHEAVRILGRLREEWARTRPWPVSFSAGVAELAAHEATPDVLHRADRALYRAKEEGRDRVELAEEGSVHVGAPTGRGGQQDRRSA